MGIGKEGCWGDQGKREEAFLFQVLFVVWTSQTRSRTLGVDGPMKCRVGSRCLFGGQPGLS